jgi:RHS repeat-associated protein
VGNKRSDAETGLYYNVTRYYDPKVGRFISADDINYLDPESIGGLNLFAYCGNNPVMGYDPMGTWDWGKFWKVTATVAIAALAIGTVVMTAGAASAAIAPIVFAYTGIAAATTSAAVIGAAVVTSVSIAAFAVADTQMILTDGESNYLGFLGDSYDTIKGGFYLASMAFPYASQFAQPGWGKQLSGTKDAPQNGPKYGSYTKINPKGNDMTIYNGRGQSIYRFDTSHPHNGWQPHVHNINWWIHGKKWRWNGPKGEVFPFE